MCVGPKLPADLQAAHAGQHEVEHHQVVIVDAGLLECGGAVVHDIDGERLLAQSAGEHGRRLAFVFHDEDPHAGRSVATLHDIRFQ